MLRKPVKYNYTFNRWFSAGIATVNNQILKRKKKSKKKQEPTDPCFHYFFEMLFLPHRVFIENIF